MRTLYLLCEGVKKSPDSQILNIVIDGIAGVELIPMGGKFGSGAYLQGFLGSLSNSNTLYLTFRDRDFDAPVPQNECLSQSPLQAKVYMSYRSTIENYLLLPENILVFCEKNNILLENGNEINNIQVLFRKAAQDLKYYQAARWALGDMRDLVRFNTSWVDGSGSLPTDFN